MLHVFYGPDEYRAAEALDELRARLDGDGMLATNTTVLTGRGLRPGDLVQQAMAAPFMGDVRLVIVDGLLTALGSRRGIVDEWQPLLDVLPSMPAQNEVVLREPPPRDQRDALGRSPLLTALKDLDVATVTRFDELRVYGQRGGQSPVAEWLRGRADRLGVPIEDAAIRSLVDLVGSDLRMLASEIDKLATYAGERTITATDVAALTPEAREQSIFDVVDAVVEGRAPTALLTVERMLTAGTNTPLRIQAMIARQVRHLVRAAELLEGGASEEQIGAACGIRGFPATKLMRQARASTGAQAEAALRAIEASDSAVKTGELPERLALELLIVELARGFGAAPAATRSR
jgi:DNA polymerase-3 subunit delta